MSKEQVLRFLKIVFVTAAMLLVTVCIGPILTDSYEPNDSIDQAASISLGSIQATIEPSDDEDYYKVVLSGSDQVNVSYSLSVPSVLMPEITFYNSSQTFLDTKRADTSGQSLSGTISTPAGDFYIRVRTFDYSTSDTSYTLTLNETSTAKR